MTRAFAASEVRFNGKPVSGVSAFTFGGGFHACRLIALHEVESSALLALKHLGPMYRDDLAAHLVKMGYFPAQAFVALQQILVDGRAHRAPGDGRMRVPRYVAPTDWPHPKVWSIVGSSPPPVRSAWRAVMRSFTRLLKLCFGPV